MQPIQRPNPASKLANRRRIPPTRLAETKHWKNSKTVKRPTTKKPIVAANFFGASFVALYPS